MRIDVFTLVPHAFAWLTEQQPIAGVLGTELELRLVNYRETTPLRAGQVDDEPYGGGAGMVLRVDVVAAALEAVYGDGPAGARDRADAAGPAADAADRRGARAASSTSRSCRRASKASTSGSSSISRPTRSRSARTCSRTATCRRWCCSTRSRGGSRARSPRGRASSRASRRSSAAGSSTRTTRARRSSAAGRCPTSCSRATTRRSKPGAGSTCDERPARPSLPRPAAGRPRRARLGADDRRRDRDRVRAEDVGGQPIPHPVVVDGADAALREARRRAARRSFSDRVLANRFIYHFRNPKRGEIIVFNTPPEAKIRCGAGRDVREAADRPARRDRQRARRHRLHQRRASSRSRTSPPTAATTTRRGRWPKIPKGDYFFMGDNRAPVLRLAGLGAGAAEEPDRRGVLRLLAAESDSVFANLAPRPAGPLSI